MSNGAIEVHHGEIADLDIDGENGPRADDHTFAEFHAVPEMGLRVDEGQKFRSSCDERGDELLLKGRHTEASEVDSIRRRLMAGERVHRREATEGGEGVRVIVEETGQGQARSQSGCWLAQT